MRRVVLALGLLLFTGARAQTGDAPLRADELFGPGAPGANLASEDAVVLLAADYFILHPDGRIDHGRHRLVRLQSEFAIDALGDPRVPYDTLDQELVIHACRTYTPDGRVVEAAPHAFNRTTPDAVAGCPDRMHHQEMVISHTGIERGCVIELDVEVRDRVPRAPWLEGIVAAQEEYPVVRRVVTVKVPAGVALRREVAGGALAEETVAGRFDPPESGEAEIHVWRGGNLPAARESDDGAGGRATRANLVFSTCPSWEALAARVTGDLDAGTAAPLADWLAAKGRETDALTERDRVGAILELTGTDIAGASAAPFDDYRAPRPAARVFATACGDDWERAALALSLLRGAGIAAEIALRPVLPRPSREVPALAQFDGVLLRTESGETLDPVAGERLAEPDRPLFLPAAARWREAEPAASRAEVAVALTIDAKGGAKGEADLRLTGTLHPYAKMTDLDAFLDGYVARLLPGAKVRGKQIAELTPEIARLRVSFAADTLLRDSNHLARLTLGGGPVDPAQILAGFNMRRPERTTAIVLPAPLSESVTWRIALPKGETPVHLPVARSIENGAGAFHLEVEEAARAPIVVRWTLTLPASEIPPDRYGALRALYEAFASEPARLLIVRVGSRSR
jgi:hypothetical protein